MSLCIYVHTKKERLSAIGPDNSYQVDKCTCPNYECHKKQKASFAQLRWTDTDRRNASDSSAQKGDQVADELECETEEVCESNLKETKTHTADVNSNRGPKASKMEMMEYELVSSIRNAAANLTKIQEYEIGEMKNQDPQDIF